MKKILCALVALALVLGLAACGAKEEPATYSDAGYYTIFSITEDDDTLTQDQFAALDWTVYLQLNEDGTGVLDLDDGDVTEFTWQDGSITAEGEAVPYNLAGGMLTLDLSDDDGAFVMIFQKGDPDAFQAAPAEAAADEAPAEEPEEPAEEPEDLGDPADSQVVGSYKLTAMEGDEAVTAEELEALETLGLTCELVMDTDGTGALVLFGEAMDLTWDDTAVTVDGESVPYDYTDGVLSLSEDGTALVFTKYSDEVIFPDLSEAGAFDLDDLEDDEALEEAEPHEAPALPDGDFEPVGGDVGDYHVEIVGAEAFTDSDGEDAVRFYYDFTNNSDELAYAWLPLYLSAEEDGYELVSAYAPWDEQVPESDNEDLSVQPGVTVRCVKEFSFQPTGSVLTFSISVYSGDPVTAVFDAQALPGRPAEELEIVPIEDPQYFIDYPAAASTNNIAAEINAANIATDYSTGDDCIRVVFSVTNNTDEAQSPLWLTTVRAYQDGLELLNAYTADEDGQEDAYYDDVEPGETTYFAYAWALRSDSPVEVTLQDYTDYGSGVIIAGTFTLD